MKFDDLLHEVGEFGTYQKWVYLFVCIPGLSVGAVMLLNVIILGTPEHRYVITVNSEIFASFLYSRNFAYHYGNVTKTKGNISHKRAERSALSKQVITKLQGTNTTV